MLYIIQINLMDYKTFDHILSKDLCDQILNISQQKTFEQQLTYHRKTKKYIYDDNKRKSTFIVINNTKIKDELLQLIRKNIHPNSQFENNLRIIKYEKGGFFKSHKDHIFNTKADKSYTLLIYLNQDCIGGNTILIDPSIKRYYPIEPKKGRILIFNPQILHLGEKVYEGIKYILTTQISYYQSSSEKNPGPTSFMEPESESDSGPTSFIQL